MIRVLHITGTLDCGGIESFIMNLYRNLDRSIVQFDFVVPLEKEYYYNDEIRRLGGKIYCIPSRRKGIIKNQLLLKRFFGEHKEYKIVHHHASSLSYITPLKIARSFNVPVRIIHSHSVNVGGNAFHKYLHYLNKLTINNIATCFYACSKPAAKWLYPRQIYNINGFEIINNAIDLKKFNYSISKRNSIRNELNIENKFVVGHIGRFQYAKNHDFIIDIFEKIQQTRPDSVLLLVGDGELKKEIMEKVDSKFLTDKVIFTGTRSDIPELLQAMDIFLFPSHYEGLGIVLVEAQATGLKCFTSAKVVPKDVNITGQVKFIELHKPANEWADIVLKHSKYKRSDNINALKNGGYDIKDVAIKLQKYYIKEASK